MIRFDRAANAAKQAEKPASRNLRDPGRRSVHPDNLRLTRHDDAEHSHDATQSQQLMTLAKLREKFQTKTQVRQELTAEHVSELRPRGVF